MFHHARKHRDLHLPAVVYCFKGLSAVLKWFIDHPQLPAVGDRHFKPSTTVSFWKQFQKSITTPQLPETGSQTIDSCQLLETVSSAIQSCSLQAVYLPSAAVYCVYM
jgi:hypothetical protein